LLEQSGLAEFGLSKHILVATVVVALFGGLKLTISITHSIKTPVAASILGVAETHLYSLLRKRKIPTPSKDTSGDYCWTEVDLDAARQAIAKRQKKAAPASA